MKEGWKKRIAYFVGLFLALYLFLFSIVLFKRSFSEFGYDFLKDSVSSASPLNALGLGWLLTIIMQSSGVATSALASLHSIGIISPVLLVYMVIGTRVGTTITALFISLLVSAKKRDFRHGFEVGIANLVYAFPIVAIMFFGEYLFSFFSKWGRMIYSLNVPFKLHFINIATSPLIQAMEFLPSVFLAIIAGILLIASIRFMPKCMIGVWGEGHIKKKINNSFGHKLNSFLIGFIIAAFLTSTSITISLLIPLIVSRFVNLKRAIPYIIGTNLGGVMDAVLGGFAVGELAIPAVFTYISFSFIGLLWLLNTDLMFKVTKYISKKMFNISRARAILFLLIFIFLAVILSFI